MKSSINKQQLLIEFISVVFAVILALLLNGWRESSAMKADLQKVEETIQKEIIRNDSLLQQSNSYRKVLLSKLYNNDNLLLKLAIQEIPVDVTNDKILANFFRDVLLFQQKQYFDHVSIESSGEQKVLILDNNVFDLVLKNDSLSMLGIGNIQLNVPDLSNLSWQLAQATNTVTLMEVSLVEKLGRLNALMLTYDKTCSDAHKMIFQDNQKKMTGIIEDMYNLEKKIMTTNKEILAELR